MRILSLLHRWAGGITGLLLALIGLSGVLLVWEESWIGLPGSSDVLDRDPAAIGQAVAAALEVDPDLSRITFAGEDMALHQAIYSDDSGAYLNQAGEVVDRWGSMWGRPELWLFDLHHYLFAGETGKIITGVLGVLLAAFTITGMILWWRTRRKFEFRLWPRRLTKSAVIRQHRDLGAVASPLLLMAAFTGTMMIFPEVSKWILAPFAEEEAAAAVPTGVPRPGSDTDWPGLLMMAQRAFPDAAPRRIMMPNEPGAPVVLRMKQDFEWTPNGRTYVYLDPVSENVLSTVDPANGDTASAIAEKYYPVHAGKVGGFFWKVLLTFGGFALSILGLLATWSFWFAGNNKRRLPLLRERALNFAVLPDASGGEGADPSPARSPPPLSH